ncbi:helix-turn-helix transcriptional regulator [Amycolatopsis sp. YIM 10]|uniref:ArsR/SmtB family transcription factor n=1 Tax=Amycolatopsis sp. YIM 10 TaxID=2653857 RepID=UPI0012908595|nr:helix-turn-helix domain-containing protein [Amycolatopsis sp. YIM 10]QFU89677.1 Helix-turn-helix domain protein [Amycolatopsis sp. YIM 10]
MPKLRIHFTDLDLARTRLKLEIDLMWEIISSVQLLQHADGGLAFGPWRRRVREHAPRDGDLRAAIQTLMTVAPHATYFPDFLTPTPDISDIDTGVEAVLSTPPCRLREEIGRLQPTGSAETRWLAELADGKSAALRQLRQALRRYFKALIEPHLQVVEDGLRADRADGIQCYLRTGPEGLLRWLGPTMSWQPPVLTADYPVDRDLHLDGRGLVLIPSYFCLYHPVALADPLQRPVLVFPIRTESRLLAGGHGSGDHPGALLGTTRATILRSVTNGSTTTKLARQAGVTPATVSHHTSVLRDAGLITTDRHENFATHLITPLGLAVLTSNPDGTP